MKASCRPKAVVHEGRTSDKVNHAIDIGDHIYFMDYDPISEVIDEPLSIDRNVLVELQELRHAEKLADLPGVDTGDEKARLSTVLDNLLDRLLLGVETHPSKLWVLTEFQAALELVESEDTEGREHFGTELESIMNILGIESSDGLLAA